MIGPKVKALLEAATSRKVYPSLAPDKIKGEYIVFTEIGAPTLNVLKGKTNLQNQRLQIDCWADNYNAAWELAATVMSAMQEPTLADSPPGFRSTQLSEPEHAVDPESRTHRVMMEFSVWERNA